MQCLQCGLHQADSRTQCLRCNMPLGSAPPPSPVDYQQPYQQGYPQGYQNPGQHYPAPTNQDPLLQAQASPIPYQAEPDQVIPVVNSIDKAGWKALGIGTVLGALLIAFFPTISFLLHPLITIVHELGHAAAAWAFGCPAIPAFDFNYGGGVTAKTDRQLPLLILIYVILGLGCYFFRKNRLTVALLVGLIILHIACVLTTMDEFLFSFMGHGTELIIAGVFIYRAISGSSIIHQVERPLYATLGMFMEFYDIHFFYMLYSSMDARIDYEEAKGGMGMDFSIIANQYFNGRLILISLIFVFCCMAVPIISFLVFRYKRLIDDLVERVIHFES